MAKGKFSQPRARIRDDIEIDPQLDEQLGEQIDFPNGSELPAFDDPAEAYEDDYTPAMEHNKKIVMVTLCVLALVVLIGAIVSIGYLLSSAADNGLILNNVTVAGVNLGGMTREEAANALHQATDLTYTQTDMVITLPDTTLVLSPADTHASLDVDAAVEAAYQYGRTGSKSEQEAALAQSQRGQYHIALLSYMTLDTTYIRAQLDAYADGFNSTYSDSSYRLEGEMPELKEDVFDEDAPCQTLLLTIGTPGQHLDIDALYNRILDAYSFNTFCVDAKDDAPVTQPEPLDPDAIFDELNIEPQDAEIDMKTFDVIPGSYGYTFNLDNAKKLLAEAEPNATVEIPMEYVKPEKNMDNISDILFADVLSSTKTKHTNNENRNTNLKLACKALNGLVLMPGEQLSYNEALGKRTAEAGYKPAAAYSGGETVQEIGGGICQVSSTLYYAALLADLQIDSRQAHSYVPSYIDYGMDATVSWGNPDFKFTNNTNYPIRIEAEVKDGYVQIRILGTDDKDYYVKMEYSIVSVIGFDTEYKEYPSDNDKGYQDGDVITTPYTGYTVKTYRCKYDKKTDKLITRDLEATSKYKSRNEVIVKIVDETEPPTEEPTEPPTEEPTDQPTEGPTEGTTEAPTEESTEPPTEGTTETSTEAPTEAPTQTATEAPTQTATEAPTQPETPATSE